jgi:hypothetical protein
MRRVDMGALALHGCVFRGCCQPKVNHQLSFWISQYPGIAQLSAVAPTSKLQLARAFALQARASNSPARAKARIEYQDFLSLWKDADPGIPILKEAQAEVAALK